MSSPGPEAVAPTTPASRRLSPSHPPPGPLAGRSWGLRGATSGHRDGHHAFDGFAWQRSRLDGLVVPDEHFGGVGFGIHEAVEDPLLARAVGLDEPVGAEADRLVDPRRQLGDFGALSSAPSRI